MIKTVPIHIDSELSARKTRLSQAIGPRIATWNAIVRKGMDAFEAEVELQNRETHSQRCNTTTQGADL